MKLAAVLIVLVVAAVVYTFGYKHPLLHALQLLLIALAILINGKSRARQKISFWIALIAFALLLFTNWVL
ncbi:MAG TPA: hypothetical protein VF648_03160 [Pyrinomonadaceae bacterium]